MLSTLRVRFADRPNVELTVDAGDAADAWALLRAQAGADGRIVVSDHESCHLDEVVGVEIVRPRPVEGPGYERRGLQDEDLSAALDENYDPPT
jgi:hypothetical protein